MRRRNTALEGPTRTRFAGPRKSFARLYFRDSIESTAARPPLAKPRTDTAGMSLVRASTPISTTSIQSATAADGSAADPTDPTDDSSAAGGAAEGTQPSFRMGNLGRHSLIYGLGILLTKAVAFLMLPIYTRFLTPADYGILQLVTMILEVATIFAGSRIAYGIFVYYHKAEDEDGRRAVLSTALILLGATYGLAALATIALAPQIASVVFGAEGRFTTYVTLAALGMAFESLILVPTSLFRLRDDSRAFVLVSLARLVLQVALNLVTLVVLDMGVSGVLVSGLLSNLVVGGWLAIGMVRDVGFRFRWAEGREFIRFGLPLVAMQVATFVYTFGDRYFLNRAADEAAVGVYGLAYQFGFLVGTLGFMPFALVWDPMRFGVAKRPDRDAIYARVFVYLNLVFISASLGVSMFAGDVLKLIADQNFHAAAAFIPAIVVAYVFQAWGSFMNIGMFVTEKPGYFTWANYAAAFVAVAGYMLLIPRWLIWGAAITTVASLFTRFCLTYLFSQRLWPVRYEWAPVVRVILVAGAIGAVSAFAPDLTLVVSIGFHLLLFGLYSVLLWKWLLTDDDRLAARRFFGRVGGRATASLDSAR